MLLMNHGDSENSDSSMKLKNNVLSSIPNVTIKEFHLNSVENLITSEKTVFLPISDLSNSHHKEKSLFGKTLTMVVNLLPTRRVLNVLNHMSLPLNK